MEAVSNDTPQKLHRRDALGDRAGEDWRDLFEAVAAGRLSALEDLYDAAAPRLYGLALWRTGSAEDAADVVQDVFVRVAEQGARLRKVRDPKRWLLAVAHRAAVDVTRRRRRRPSEPLEDHPFLSADVDEGERVLRAVQVSAMLAGLPSALREVLYLKHFLGCTFAEIGEVVGAPTFTAASRYRSGVLKLRRLLEGDDEAR